MGCKRINEGTWGLEGALETFIKLKLNSKQKKGFLLVGWNMAWPGVSDYTSIFRDGEEK